MIPTFLLNPKLYIYLGIALLITAAAIKINMWDNARLDKAYHDGANAMTLLYIQEMDKVQKETARITQLYGQELVKRLSAEQEARNPNIETINTYVKETVFSCSPDAKYLQLWDNTVADPSGNKSLSTGNSEPSQVSSFAETAR